MLYAVLLALWVWRGPGLGVPGFYLIFALPITASVQLIRDAEIANVAFLAELVGCSARRYECRVAGHTNA